MALPFTVEEFYGVFRAYNRAVWPVQWLVVALAIAALAALLWPRPWSGVAVSAVLAVLWACIAVAYHLAFFARISPAAYGFAALSAVGAAVFALVVYPVWSACAGHPFPATPTYGLSCPTTIFTIGLLCFAVPPTPRSPLFAPWLWCLVGAQAAFVVGVQPDLGLIAAAVVGMGLLATAGQRPGTSRP